MNCHIKFVLPVIYLQKTFYRRFATTTECPLSSDTLLNLALKLSLSRLNETVESRAYILLPIFEFEYVGTDDLK